MTVYVTGDIHGGLDMQKLRDWELGDSLTSDDYLIVAGDFGFPWDFSAEECADIAWLESRPYSSWWPQELPDERNFEEARAKLDSVGWKVDYAVTHTCSTRVLSPTLYPAPGWNYPAVDRLTAFFDELEDRLDYKRWYHGHFHRDANPAERHTVLYDCIVRLGDELQPWDVA